MKMLGTLIASIVPTGLLLFAGQSARKKRLTFERAKTRLKLDEPLFKRIFVSNILGLFFTDSDGVVIDANDEFLRILGFDRQDLERGKINWRHLTPKEYRQIDDEKALEYQRTGFVAPFEKRYYRKDGSLVDVLVGATEVDPANPTSVVAYVVDITDQKRAEDRLRLTNLELDRRVMERTRELSETNQFLDLVLEHVPHAIFVKDAKTFQVVRVNKAAEKLVGRPREEIFGIDIYAAIPKEQADEVTARDREVVEKRTFVETQELEIPQQNGPSRFLHTKRMPLFTHDGTLRYVLVIAEDITDRKRMDRERLEMAREQAKWDEEARNTARIRALWEATAALGASLDYQKTLKCMVDAVVPALADMSWIIIKGDDGSIKVIPSSDEPELSALRKKLVESYPPALDGPSISAHVFRSGEPKMIVDMDENTEALKRAATSPEHEALLQALQMRSFICVPLKVLGKPVGVLGITMTSKSNRRYSELDLKVVQTLAERAGVAMENAKLYETAKRANRVKDDFLATLSHELRTPLNVILGHVDLLNSEALDVEETKKAIAAIERNARTQAQIVTDLIDVSSVISGKLSFKPQPIAPVEILRNAIENSESVAKKKGVIIEASFSYGDTMDADPLRLQQIAWNLLTNAVKFTPAGGRVTLTFKREGDDCILQVRDTGKGIDPGFLPFVFDPFRQEDSNLNRGYGGLGLGLSIVKSLVELHSGTVRVESEGAGRGATFTVTLPVRQAATRRDLPPPRVVTKEDLDLHGRSILVVEDSEESRYLVKRFLERAGAQVHAVESGKDALSCLEHERFDAIVSDISMPEMDGFEFMKTWRKRETENHLFIPAAALTAYTRDEEKEKAFDAGFQSHIKKPAQAVNLVKSVHDLVSTQWH